MSTTKKLLLVAGLTALTVVLVKGATTAKKWAGQITIKIVEFFQPTIKNGLLIVPVKVRVINPSPLFAPVQSASVKLFYLRNGMFVPFAQAPPTPGFDINPNQSTDVTLFPEINVKALGSAFGGSNTVSNWLAVLSNQNPLIDIKLEVTITIAGISFTEEEFKQVYLKQLVGNVA